MNKTILYLGLVLVCLFPSSCIRHDESLTINHYLTDRSIRGKKWYVQKVLINGQESHLDCKRDDIWVFAESEDPNVRGGVLTIEPDFIKCHRDDRVLKISFLYGVNNSNFVYFLDPENNFMVQHEIMEISDDYMMIRFNEEDGYGIKLNTYEYYFHHK